MPQPYIEPSQTACILLSYVAKIKTGTPHSHTSSFCFTKSLKETFIDIQNIFFRFLWNNERDKIKR
jgi:hypothetical protein